MTILSIILFIIALSVLIVIHELGHLLAAKTFKVYCSDFSIGFGPKIINIKRKKGETNFQLRIFPFGGFVSMYGEGVQLEDGVDIPKSRSLEGIARYKRIIIMASGIVMNFVLAFLIFFISASCFPQYDLGYINVFRPSVDTYTEKAMFVDDTDTPIEFSAEDPIAMNVGSFYFKTDNEKTYTFANLFKPLNSSDHIYEDSYFTQEIDGKTYYYVLGYKNIDSIYALDDLSNFVEIYSAKLYENVQYDIQTGIDSEGKAIIETKSGSFYLPAVDEQTNKVTAYTFSADKETSFTPFRVGYKYINNKEDNSIKYGYLKLTNAKSKTKLDDFGFGLNYKKYWLGWGSFQRAGEQWVDATTVVAKALGQLFVGSGWNNVGGPVAILTQTTQILKNNPFNYYLNTWGVISVNLALFNLLPFPGLDGWQMLVVIVEGAVNFFKRRKYNIENGKKTSKNLLLELEKLNSEINDIKQKFNVTTNQKFDENHLASVCNLNKLPEEMTTEEKFYKQYLVASDAKKTFIEENNLTGIAAFEEWKIPEKIKNIVSYIGLALLMALAVGILIKDIIGLF